VDYLQGFFLAQPGREPTGVSREGLELIRQMADK
jgi:hypothetical protein